MFLDKKSRLFKKEGRYTLVFKTNNKRILYVLFEAKKHKITFFGKKTRYGAVIYL